MEIRYCRTVVHVHMLMRMQCMYLNNCDVCVYIVEVPSPIYPLTEKEWEVLSQFVEVMEPFALASKQLEGSSYSTLSTVYPAIAMLMTHVKGIDKRYIYILYISKN